MNEQAVVEYLANALWQIPLLAGGAWILLWAVRASVRVQHVVWLTVLAAGVVLPLHGRHAAQQDNTATQQEDATALPRISRNRSNAPRSAANVGGDANAGAAEEGVQPRFRIGSILPEPHELRLSDTAAAWLVRVYAVSLLFGVLRFVHAWRTARSLVADACDAAVSGRVRELMEEQARSFGIDAPRTCESDRVASPVVAGLWTPVLLLPKGFAGRPEDEVRAVLCHELAHIRRRDYLANVLCRLAALPVDWHPAIHAVQRRIRRTREMVCDAMAAEAMRSEITYARCLLAMARSITAGPAMASHAQGVGLFSGNALEERVMKLTETKRSMSAGAKAARAMSGAAAMAAALGAATAIHVTPAMAQTATHAALTQSAPAASAKTQTELLAQNTAPAPPYAQGVSRPGPDGVDAGAAVPTAPSVPPSPPAPPVAAAPLAPRAPQAVAAPAAPVAPQAPAAPAAPAGSPAPAPAPVPAPAPAPAPLSDPAPKHDGSVHEHIHTHTGGSHEHTSGDEAFTPEQQRRFDEAMADARRKMDAARARLNSPEFRRQMEDAQRKVQEATARLNSPEFHRQMEEAQKSAKEAAERFRSGEFQRRMAEQQSRMADLHSAEIQKSVEEAMARVNSPEFRQRMEDAQRRAAEASAKVNSPEFKARMEQMQRQIEESQTQMREQMKHLFDDVPKNAPVPAPAP